MTTQLASRRNQDFLDRRGFLNQEWKHGTRSRYVSGCRCRACRDANRLYYYVRAKEKIFGRWNGTVSATNARHHMRWLSRHGVGRRAVQAATGISDGILYLIRSGRRRNIRALTERKILAVTPQGLSDGARIPARRTWVQIHALLRDGFTKQELAQRLGSKARTPSLQIRKSVIRASTALKVQKLYSLVMMEKTAPISG